MGTRYLIEMTHTYDEDLKNEILYQVKIVMGWQDGQLQEWWYKPNLNFGNQSPEQMLVDGSGKHLLAYIKGIQK